VVLTQLEVPVVLVVIPIGIPGMGKSYQIEKTFKELDNMSLKIISLEETIEGLT